MEQLVKKNFIRCSSLNRFMSCSGFLSLPQDEKTSIEAEEGTCFHWVVERMLNGDNIIAGMKAPNDFVVDDDMIFHANWVLRVIPKQGVSEYPIEFYPSEEHNFQIKGTLDRAWEEDNGTTLVIADYKYGHRIVNVEDNWQLIGYALGFLAKTKSYYNKISMRILQPRPHHPDGPYRKVEITYDKLMEYEAKIKEQVKKYLLSDGVLSTGKHCAYCPAVNSCSAINSTFYNAIDEVRNDVKVDELSDKELSMMIDMYERVKDIFKIRADSLKDLAIERIKQGRIIDGYSIEPAFGHRKWINNFEPSTFKLMTGIDIVRPSVLSPAQVEKLGLPKEIVNSFTFNEQKGFNLVAFKATEQADKIFGKR